MAKRKYEIIAESYLTEWLGITYPPGTWRTNVNIGMPAIPEEERLTPAELRAIRRGWTGKADAVVFLPEEVHIVEAKIRDDRGKIEQLLLYKWLFYRDESFRPYWDKRVKLILLTPKDQGILEEFMAEFGIQVIYYRPLWVQEYLGTLRPFERRGTLSHIR